MEHLTKAGIEFASLEDAGDLVLRIVSDPKTNGRWFSFFSIIILLSALRVELITVKGRSFTIVPRSEVPRGYTDLNLDDPAEGTLLYKLQAIGDNANHRSKVSFHFK